MKRKFSNLLSLALVFTMVFSIVMTAPVTAEAATTRNNMIVSNGGQSYSGSFEVVTDFGYYSAGRLGKKFTIQCVNYLSQLSRSDASYFNRYASFRVWIIDEDGYIKKTYTLSNGGSFKIPKGRYKIKIFSGIKSSGWDDFPSHSNIWPFAQYRLKY